MWKQSSRFGGMIATIAFAMVLSSGCNQTKTYDIRHPHVEEFNSPPEEARYNNPPEDRYRKRQEQKDLAGSLGSNGSLGGFDSNGGGGGMGAGGIGGRR
jgi:hypothetical protein